jgi:hypothetical protein
LLFEPLEKENLHAYHNLGRYLGIGAAGRIAHVEPQQELGLFSQRRPGVSGVDLDRFAAHEPDLRFVEVIQKYRVTNRFVGVARGNSVVVWSVNKISMVYRANRNLRR